MSDDIQRDLGQIEAHLATLQREMKETRADVRSIRDEFAQVKGGARTLIGVAALIGGAISWALSHIFGAR